MSEIQSKDTDFTSGVIGDTTNLPANWQAVQDSLWQTISFQRNYNPISLTSGASALGVALAVMCADVKARDIAKCQMSLWRKIGRSYREVEPTQHWFSKKLVGRPNPFMTWTEFWRMTVFHLSLAQNSYIYKDINRLGEIVDLYPMPPVKTQHFASGGRDWYQFAFDTDLEKIRSRGADRIVMPSDRVIHLMGRTSDGISGISNLALGQPLFDLVNSIGKFQTQLFNNDGRQPIVFESDSAVFGQGDQADAAFRRLKQQLSEAVRKMNAYGEPILLEAGYKAKIIAQNAKDAMTTDAFQKTVTSLCGLLDVPPHKIFAYETVKYANMSEANNQYANDCLEPLAENIEEKFRLELFPEEEWGVYYPEFDRMPMLAGDPKTMVEVLHTAAIDGVIEINEYRDRMPLGLNPVQGGDVRYVPVNMAMVDRSGNIIGQAATGQPQNDGTTQRPVNPEDASKALAAAVKAGVEEAARRFPKPPAPVQPPPVEPVGPIVSAALQEMGKGLAEAFRNAPKPQITVPISVVMPKKGKEIMTVEHDEDGRIKRSVKEEVEE